MRIDLKFIDTSYPWEVSFNVCFDNRTVYGQTFKGNAYSLGGFHRLYNQRRYKEAYAFLKRKAQLIQSRQFENMNDIRQYILETAEYDQLKKNKKPLEPNERVLCFDKDAVWHYASSKDPRTGKTGKKVAAVWKSVDPKTRETTYITNTHRAWNKASTLKAAINKYHNFIKGTA